MKRNNNLIINIENDNDRKAIADVFEKRRSKLNGKLNRLLKLHYTLYIKNENSNISEGKFIEIMFDVLNSSLEIEFETSQELVKLEMMKTSS